MKFRHKKRFKIQDLDFTLLTHKPAKFLFHVLLQQYQVETTSYTCSNYILLFTCTSFVYQVTEFSQDYIFSCLSSSSVSPTQLLGGMTNINKSRVVTFLQNQSTSSFKRVKPPSNRTMYVTNIRTYYLAFTQGSKRAMKMETWHP